MNYNDFFKKYDKYVLELGAGKDWNLHLNKDYGVVCIDQGYDEYEEIFRDNVMLLNDNIGEFLTSHVLCKFDKIYANRVFEHIHYDQIPYILYLCHSVLVPNGIIEILVPNYMDITKHLNAFEDNLDGLTGKEFNRMMIDLHTEIFNTIEDPHQSIWTPKLAEYYMKLEDFWEDIMINTNMIKGNRSWYMEITATKKTS
jgi:predicted SAM-dependent methyltransferase